MLVSDNFMPQDIEKSSRIRALFSFQKIKKEECGCTLPLFLLRVIYRSALTDHTDFDLTRIFKL